MTTTPPQKQQQVGSLGEMRARTWRWCASILKTAEEHCLAAAKAATDGDTKAEVVNACEASSRTCMAWDIARSTRNQIGMTDGVEVREIRTDIRLKLEAFAQNIDEKLKANAKEIVDTVTAVVQHSRKP